MAVSTQLDEAQFAADVELSEYEEHDEPIELSEAAARMLTQEVNGGDDRNGERIKLRYNRDGEAIFTATSYVGIVSLRDGPTIQIQPKAAGTNLFSLLRYAHNTTATTFETQTPYRQGQTFLDALGALYEAELRRVLNKGLHTDYQRKSSTEQHLRGQLDLQRQLQRHPPAPTAFECTYDELTHDITANRAILYATTILLGLVSDPSISRSLQQHKQLLRRRVTLQPVTIQQVERIQLTRLSDYYEDVLRLARLVIGNVFIGELEAGASASFAMLVNMNTVFENAVERAARAAVTDRDGWRVVPQDRSQSLLTGGRHDVTLKPDVTVFDSTDSVRMVGDAKWKTSSPKNADFYQMTSYMLARDAPGILFYPDCNGTNMSRSVVAEQYPLELVELPTSEEAGNHGEFVTVFERAVAASLSVTE